MELPKTAEGILLLLGALLVLIAIVGGGFEVSAIKIPSVSKYPRVLAFVLGIACIAAAVNSRFFPHDSTSSSPPPGPEQTHTPLKTAPKVEVQLFHSTSEVVAHPEAHVTVPSDYKIIGGGARVNYEGAGNLLTASFPQDQRTWVARSKDHVISSPASLDVWAIGLHDPEDQWEVTIQSATSAPMQHATVSTTLPQGFVMTGGGAEARWESQGSLLTASFPVDGQTWEARCKDHRVAEAVVLAVYVIGIRPRNGAPVPANQIFTFASQTDPHPSATARVSAGYIMVGGGASVDWHGAGNMLTSSYPDGSGGWVGAAKDHIDSDPAAITAYVIGLRQ